jgi:DNA-binding CsgD family transcriptional regulator
VPLVQDLKAADRNGLEVVQDFVEAAARAGSMAELRSLIGDATRDLGFDYFAIVHHVCFGRPSDNNVRLSNYPLEWLALMREEGRPSDPVLRAAERACSGFRWSDLETLLPLTAGERDHLALAASFGIAEGFTVPNHVPGETFGSCNFAVLSDREFPSQTVSAAQALGSFAFEAARRLLRERPGEIYLQPAPLSDRQRECLLFVAKGKSDSVIAELLAIRPRTVNEHIEAAKRRYSVSTRSQLLVRALFRSEICFAEVIE